MLNRTRPTATNIGHSPVGSLLAAGAATGGLAALGPFATRTLGATTHEAADVPPPQESVSVNVLPAGESGLYPIVSQVVYELEKKPAVFGPHVDDQRQMYWNFQYKPAGFETPSGTPTSPIPGVRIYRGAHGVPLVYGDDTYALWYGVGYAAAQDRLFQIDAIRRTARGTLAELAGSSALPGDVQVRVVSYTDQEYDHMFAHAPDRGGPDRGRRLHRRHQRVDRSPAVAPHRYPR